MPFLRASCLLWSRRTPTRQPARNSLLVTQSVVALSSPVNPFQPIYSLWSYSPVDWWEEVGEVFKSEIPGIVFKEKGRNSFERFPAPWWIGLPRAYLVEVLRSKMKIHFPATTARVTVVVVLCISILIGNGCVAFMLPLWISVVHE